MIEKIILDYLTSELDIPVHMEVPKDSPNLFAIIEKTGSSHFNQIDRAAIIIQSYSRESLYNAALLNEKIKKVMSGMLELENISAVRLSSDYNFTDPETKMYRYQAVYEVVYIDLPEDD